jgi:HK97 family phage major capsid protein
MSNIAEEYNGAVSRLDAAYEKLLKAQARVADPAEVERLQAAFEEAEREASRLDAKCRDAEARRRAKAQHIPMADGSSRLQVSEPDMYMRGGRSFFADLYAAQLKEDVAARNRIEMHHTYELEKRAITSSTVGGIIPPAYLVDLYAKASRNGRVLADQMNGQPLPDVGMSLIVPRLTQGLAAGVQATENTTVSTQDPTETDLTVPVRTIAGYSPVSRQTIERAAYSDQILMEDLIARYWAQLDTQCISGSGSSGQILGVLNTSNVSASTASTATVAGIYPKIADVIQQVNTATGGLGYTCDKIILHPRRWGWLTAQLDSSNRPLMVPEGGSQGVGFNVIAVGESSGYGGPVGRMHGLPVFTDANIPVALGSGTNEDRIIVFASGVQHLWERPEDPVTLSFEQTGATSLQVNLICYGYAAATFGRYPPAAGVVSGGGLVTPVF